MYFARPPVPQCSHRTNRINFLPLTVVRGKDQQNKPSSRESISQEFCMHAGPTFNNQQNIESMLSLSYVIIRFCFCLLLTPLPSPPRLFRARTPTISILKIAPNLDGNSGASSREAATAAANAKSTGGSSSSSVAGAAGAESGGRAGGFGQAALSTATAPVYYFFGLLGGVTGWFSDVVFEVGGGRRVGFFFFILRSVEMYIYTFRLYIRACRRHEAGCIIFCFAVVLACV